MLVVGITGGIGSGKSTVSRVFEKLGARAYYSDTRAKYLMTSDPELIAGIKSLLGEQAYVGGEIDRAYVASRIFNDGDLIREVNRIVHPAVGRDFERWAADMRRRDIPYIILESAILFESGFDSYADYVLTVSAPVGERIARASARDGMDAARIRERAASQMTDSEREARADFTIENHDNIMILPRIIKLHNYFTNEGRRAKS